MTENAPETAEPVAPEAPENTPGHEVPQPGAPTQEELDNDPNLFPVQHSGDDAGVDEHGN